MPMMCLWHPRQPVERIDSGTVNEIVQAGVYYAARERLVFCKLCGAPRIQNVEVRIRDGGATTRRRVTMKLSRNENGAE